MPLSKCHDQNVSSIVLPAGIPVAGYKGFFNVKEEMNQVATYIAFEKILTACGTERLRMSKLHNNLKISLPEGNWKKICL